MSEEPGSANVLRLVPQSGAVQADADECGLVVTYKPRKCRHDRLEVDKQNHVVECKNCGERVDPFEALLVLAEEGSRYRDYYKSRRDELEKLNNYQPHLKAVRSLEGTWRGSMLPTCPHCHRGVEAAELASSGAINRAIATRMREVETQHDAGSMKQPHPLDEPDEG